MRKTTPSDAEKVLNADTLVFSTPIYYYEMSGQMKTLLDRMNPLYSADYRFRRVYMLSVAAEDEAHIPEKAVSGLEGWGDCFEKAKLCGLSVCGRIERARRSRRKRRGSGKGVPVWEKFEISGQTIKKTGACLDNAPVFD